MFFDYFLPCNKLLQTLFKNLRCRGRRRVKKLPAQVWKLVFRSTNLHRKPGRVEPVFITPVLGSEAETGGLLGLAKDKSSFRFNGRPLIQTKTESGSRRHPTFSSGLGPCVYRHPHLHALILKTHTHQSALWIISVVIIVKAYSKITTRIYIDISREAREDNNFCR